MGKLQADADVRRLVGDLLRAVRGMDSDMRSAVDELGDDAEIIYAGHALKSTGRMARGIKAHRAGDTVLVDVEAKNPLTGFDYVAVTRFGHRVRWILPRWDRGKASVIKTGRARKQRKGAALRLMTGGKANFRRRVPGFKPDSDWAERAWPQVKAEAERVSDRLGAKLLARFG